MSRKQQLPAVLAVTVVAALLSACGASAPTVARGNGSAVKAVKAEKFARCMRKNGVSQFPDPPASGNFTIDEIANGSSLNINAPAFTQALASCKKLEPTGFTGSKRSPNQQHAALKFARCMREHGVPDFPDPTPNTPLIDTNLIPSANRPGGITALNRARHRCSAIAAEVIGRQQ
jgi:hypothetical protein